MVAVFMFSTCTHRLTHGVPSTMCGTFGVWLRSRAFGGRHDLTLDRTGLPLWILLVSAETPHRKRPRIQNLDREGRTLHHRRVKCDLEARTGNLQRGRRIQMETPMNNQGSTSLPWAQFLSEFIGTAILLLLGLSLVIAMYGAGSPIAVLLPDMRQRMIISGFLFGSIGGSIALSQVGKVGFWLIG